MSNILLKITCPLNYTPMKHDSRFLFIYLSFKPANTAV